MLTLNEYQTQAKSTCEGNSYSYSYLGDGIVEELGELKGKIAKMVRKNQLPVNFSRDDVMSLPGDIKDALKKETGDILWFVAVLSDWFGWEFNDVAQSNLDKLKDRSRRRVIIGDGDYR